jgi:hypothetical protein
MQRTVSVYFRTPTTVRSALVQLRVQAIFVGARAEGKPPSPPIYGRTGCSCIDRAALGDRASLYGDTRRCGRAGEVLSREEIPERGRHLQRQGKQASELRQASSTKRGAWSKDGLWDEAKRTGDSQQGREWDVAYGRPDTVSRWGLRRRGRCRGGFNPLRRPPSCASKAPGDPSFTRASFSFLPAYVTPPLLFHNLLPSLVWIGDLISKDTLAVVLYPKSRRYRRKRR